MLTLPIVDLTNDAATLQAETIRDALGSTGFFEVRNSGLDPTMIERMFSLSEEYFDQPFETKAQFPADENGSGYYRPHEQALGLYKRDNKEAFLYGRNTANKPQQLPSPFTPSSQADADLKQFYAQCHETSEKLLELFAMALNLPYEHFRKAHSFGEKTALSMIYYPTIPPDERDGAIETDIRSGEHKDWGTLTMLFQKPGGQPGLQVYLPTSTVPTPPVDLAHKSEYTYEGSWGWYDAPIPPLGGFLVNVGLAMELWSAAAYKATLHRVIFPPPKDGRLDGRYSITYFVQPDDEVVIRQVMGGKEVGEGVTSKELFGGKLKESFDRIKAMPMRVQGV